MGGYVSDYFLAAHSNFLKSSLVAWKLLKAKKLSESLKFIFTLQGFFSRLLAVASYTV